MAVWGKWLVESQLVPGIGVTEVRRRSSSSPPSPSPALKKAIQLLLGEPKQLLRNHLL